MRKWISVALLLGTSNLVMADPMNQSPFAGFHVGANVSYNLTSATNAYDTNIKIITHDTKTNTDSTIAVDSNYLQSNLASTMGAGATLGYNLQFGPKFILGLETRLLTPQSYKSDTSRSLSLSLPDEIMPGFSNLSIESQATSRLDFGNTWDVLLKYGYLLASDKMVYGITGVGFTKATFTISSMFSSRELPSISLGELNANKSLVPLVVGAGYEQFLASNISVNFELDETFYPKVTTTKSFTTPPISDITPVMNTTATVKSITAFAANLGINYYF